MNRFPGVPILALSKAARFEQAAGRAVTADVRADLLHAAVVLRLAAGQLSCVAASTQAGNVGRAERGVT